MGVAAVETGKRVREYSGKAAYIATSAEASLVDLILMGGLAVENWLTAIDFRRRRRSIYMLGWMTPEQ